MKKKTVVLPLILLSSFIAISCSSNNSDISSSEQSKLITPDIIEAANNFEYSFDPKTVYIEKQDSYDYSNEELANLQVGETRENHYLIYVFEGQEDEAFLPEPPLITGYFYLWDDGLYAALINDVTIKGYWYNSLENENNCLKLISNQEHFEEIIANFYEDAHYLYQMYAYEPSFKWGTRYLLMKGYYYYPNVAISFLDYFNDEYCFKVGDSFIAKNLYTVVRILKDLNFIPLLYNEKDAVVWDVPEGMLDSSSNIISSGEYTITAHYKNLSNSIIVKVK